MLDQLFFLSLAIPLGLMSGMLMGIPGSIILIISFPMLLILDPNYAIAFYVIISITSQFTNSVMALYAGIPGDTTALPIVAERERLNIYYSIKENLQRTAVSSVIGVIVGIIYLLLFFQILAPFTNYLIRTDFVFAILCLLVLICFFWPGNKFLVNFSLVILGGIIGMVGYHHSLKLNFLTFNNPMLYGGLPFIAGFIGMYAVPNVLSLSVFYNNCEIKSRKVSKNNEYKSSSKKTVFFSIIGALTGVIGLIPLVGSSISSSFVYGISKRFTNSPLKLAVLSESSNSSAFVIVLAPLLFFGIAIVPSEMILLTSIQMNGWDITKVTNDTFILLVSAAFITLVISYFFSTTFAKFFVELLKKYLKYAIPLLISILVFNVYFVGSLTKETEIYIITFILSVLSGIMLKKMNVSSLPLIIIWGISESIIKSTVTINSLYM